MERNSKEFIELLVEHRFKEHIGEDDYKELKYVEDFLKKINKYGFRYLGDYLDLYKAQEISERLQYKYCTKFNPNHIPAGNGACSGEFCSGDGINSSGRGATTIVVSNQQLIGSYPKISNPRLIQPESDRHEARARAIYGETSGLKPQLRREGGNINNSGDWDNESVEKLREARAYIGIVSERNPRVHFVSPPVNGNSIDIDAWNSSVDAASSSYILDSRVNHFFLRQEGVGTQIPPKWRAAGYVRRVSVGPFNNVGGGDTPRGRSTYIDFYSEQ